MKYIKAFEESYDELRNRTNPIQYSIDDIIVCSSKKNKWTDFVGYIDQNGKLIHDEKYPKYGKKYEVKQIYWSGVGYNSVRKNDLGNFYVDVEDVETGKELTYIDANIFTLESDWNFPDEPMIGDYVLCDVNYQSWNEPDERLNNFINNTIGRYVEYNFNINVYIIQWTNIPRELIGDFYNNTNPYIKNLGKKHIEGSKIKVYSKNIEDLQPNLSANKYNL